MSHAHKRIALQYSHTTYIEASLSGEAFFVSKIYKKAAVTLDHPWSSRHLSIHALRNSVDPISLNKLVPDIIWHSPPFRLSINRRWSVSHSCSKLSRHVDDSRLNIDNNRAEHSVKPFVVGRKNWLFNHNHRGAVASAILYSIIETAKANSLISFDYIEHCLAQLSYPDCDLHSLLS
jgi:hypothetical protein